MTFRWIKCSSESWKVSDAIFSGRVLVIKVYSAKNDCVLESMHVCPFMVGVESVVSIVGMWLERGG